jgi:DnaJ family protein C protein 11
LISTWLDDCSTGVEVEIGGERRVSEHSSAAMFCVLGLQVSF